MLSNQVGGQTISLPLTRWTASNFVIKDPSWESSREILSPLWLLMIKLPYKSTLTCSAMDLHSLVLNLLGKSVSLLKLEMRMSLPSTVSIKAPGLRSLAFFLLNGWSKELLFGLLTLALYRLHTRIYFMSTITECNREHRYSLAIPIGSKNLMLPHILQNLFRHTSALLAGYFPNISLLSMPLKLICSTCICTMQQRGRTIIGF